MYMLHSPIQFVRHAFCILTWCPTLLVLKGRELTVLHCNEASWINRKTSESLINMPFSLIFFTIIQALKIIFLTIFRYSKIIQKSYFYNRCCTHYSKDVPVVLMRNLNAIALKSAVYRNLSFSLLAQILALWIYIYILLFIIG